MPAIKESKEREIDSYYPDESLLSLKTAEVLRLCVAGDPTAAMNEWNRLHAPGASENEELVRGVILAEMEKTEEARELLWRAYDEKRDSFIRALHWLVFVMAEEISAREEVYDSEILLERITDNWGSESVKSLALKSCFAYFTGDVFSQLEYLENIIEKCKIDADLFWAYTKIAEMTESLPCELAERRSRLLATAVKLFPTDEKIYFSWIDYLFGSRQFSVLAFLANGEIQAGNIDLRLPILIQEKLVIGLVLDESPDLSAQKVAAFSSVFEKTDNNLVKALGLGVEAEKYLKLYGQATSDKMPLKSAIKIVIDELEGYICMLDTEFLSVKTKYEKLIGNIRWKLSI